MVTSSKEPSEVGEESDEDARVVTTAGHSAVIIERKKKKKRKYSRGLGSLQRAERGFAKANARVAQAVASGLSEYYRRDNRSSRKRRDGAIRDGVRNWSEALSKALRRGARAPRDFADAFDSRAV